MVFYVRECFLQIRDTQLGPVLATRKYYYRHHDLVNRYGISVSQMTTDMFHLL